MAQVGRAPGSKTTTYTLKGIVREIDPKTGVVSIAHEAIPGFMAAMTMPFTPTDRSNLAEIGPGDEVEGPLDVTTSGDSVEDYDLRSLEVVKVAPRTLKINPGGASATLASTPRRLITGEVVPDFRMTTQDGEALSLSDLRGEVVALTFIYTRCPLPDFCPAMDRKFADLASKIEAVKGRGDRVRLLSVSFDPENDTPEALRRHAGAVGARPPLWTFAVASHEELARVLGPLGLSYGPIEDRQYRHNLSTAIIGPDGRLARLEVDRPASASSASDLLGAILPLIQTR